MLPVLKQAGVVDSGGQGLMQVLKAPRREPEEMALHKERISTSPISYKDATSLAAAIIVSVIFVPVSPSGTGKTFNARGAAIKARELADSGLDDLGEFMAQIIARADEVLEQTPEMLPDKP